MHAKESTYFMLIPSTVTINDAVSSVKAAAIKREWAVHAIENNKLRIELNHRGYRGVLEFSFTENEIHYSDLTTYYNRSKSEWELSPAPDSWIQNLRNDVTGYLQLNRRDLSVKESLTREDLTTKLETLKSLYDKKLITEAQYRSKQEEIMLRY